MAFVLVAVGCLLSGPTAAQSVEEQPLIRPEEAEITRLYQAVLDRDPDGDGYAYWVRQRTTGVSLPVVAESFVASREFELVFGTPTDAGFVDLLYRNVLERSPDDVGLDYWLAQMAAGLDRTSLVVLFAESPEFVIASGTALPVLPPFDGRIEVVTAAELGTSWRAGCPVGPEDLRRLVVRHVDFDGQSREGQLIVHVDAATDVVGVFARLYAARYPVESLVPVDRYDSDDIASMNANNSSAFNCRRVTAGTGWSDHAYGRAIDLNPIQNPYVSSSRTLPEAGGAWVDRSRHHPALIRRGDVVVRSFADIGWSWGADFRTIDDWQHFAEG